MKQQFPKRILPVFLFLILCFVLSSAMSPDVQTVSASGDTAVTDVDTDLFAANAYIDVLQKDEDTIIVSLHITPNDDICIAGFIFSINYAYPINLREYPFALNIDESTINTQFSKTSIVASNVNPGTFNCLWEDTSAVAVSAGEDITIAEIAFDISEDALDGDYSFQLDCPQFYCEDNSEMTDVFIHLPDETHFWLGERLTVNNDSVFIVASGTQETSTPSTEIVSVNKQIDASACQIGNPAIAEITEIIHLDSGETWITIMGKKVGVTTLTITGGVANTEVVTVKIEVEAPSVYWLNIPSSSTHKTTYHVGDSLDLSGLTLQVLYNNSDTETVTYTSDTASDFTIGTYDFTTAGSKRIEIGYGGQTTYIDVSVEANTPIIPDEPDIPVVTRGDMNGDKLVTDADAVYLLYYTFFPNDYPLNQSGDMNGDGIVTDADAVYLLYYTFFPNDYPL